MHDEKVGGHVIIIQCYCTDEGFETADGGFQRNIQVRRYQPGLCMNYGSQIEISQIIILDATDYCISKTNATQTHSPTSTQISSSSSSFPVVLPLPFRFLICTSSPFIAIACLPPSDASKNSLRRFLPSSSA